MTFLCLRYFEKVREMRFFAKVFGVSRWNFISRQRTTMITMAS